MSVEKLLRKLKKTYAKMLSAYARRKLAKAYELEDKAILLELELKERNLKDEVEEGFVALDRLFEHDEKHGLYDNWCTENTETKWVNLTEDEIEKISDRIKGDELLVETSTWHIRFAKAIERKLRKKNA